MSNEVFSTEDIYLASALKLAGLKLVGIERRGSRGAFQFNHSAELERLVTAFYSEELTLSVRRYVDSWMSLKKLVMR